MSEDFEKLVASTFGYPAKRPVAAHAAGRTPPTNPKPESAADAGNGRTESRTGIPHFGLEFAIDPP